MEVLREYLPTTLNGSGEIVWRKRPSRLAEPSGVLSVKPANTNGSATALFLYRAPEEYHRQPDLFEWFGCYPEPHQG